MNVLQWSRPYSSNFKTQICLVENNWILLVKYGVKIKLASVIRSKFPSACFIPCMWQRYNSFPFTCVKLFYQQRIFMWTSYISCQVFCDQRAAKNDKETARWTRKSRPTNEREARTAFRREPCSALWWSAVGQTSLLPGEHFLFSKVQGLRRKSQNKLHWLMMAVSSSRL